MYARFTGIRFWCGDFRAFVDVSINSDTERSDGELAVLETVSTSYSVNSEHATGNLRDMAENQYQHFLYWQTRLSGDRKQALRSIDSEFVVDLPPHYHEDAYNAKFSFQHYEAFTDALIAIGRLTSN